MKIAVLSDLHSKDPLPFVEKVRGEGIEAFRFLGDYDNPKLLKKILELDVNKEVLIGNHEHCWATGDSDLKSSMLEMDASDYVDYWKDYPKLIEYVKQEEAKRFSRTEKIGKINIAYCHASLVKGDGWINNAEIWERFLYDFCCRRKHIASNFTEMKEKDITLFFRGHDHLFQVWKLGDSESLHKIPAVYRNPENFNLEDGFRYIVSVGCFKFGNYCVFDTKKKSVEFKAWKD